jgi:hypothetical protein
MQCLSTSEVITCITLVGTSLAPDSADNKVALVLKPVDSSQKYIGPPLGAARVSSPKLSIDHVLN